MAAHLPLLSFLMNSEVFGIPAHLISRCPRNAQTFAELILCDAFRIGNFSGHLEQIADAMVNNVLD